MEISEDPKNLESSLPSLVEKLKGLAKTLDDDERKVFKEIVDSAAYHAHEIGSHDMGTFSVINAKPMSVHATVAMRERYMNLGNELELETDNE